MNNRIEAKRCIKELLRTDFGYIYKETKTHYRRVII